MALSGRGARVVDEWLPRCADPVGQVHAVPHLDEALAVDQSCYVVEGAFDEDDLVEVAATVQVGDVPPYVTGQGTRPEQRWWQADAPGRRAA